VSRLDVKRRHEGDHLKVGVQMKAYLGTTGVLFALVTVLHVARSVEMWHLFASEPWFVAGYALLTLATAALSVWAWALFRRVTRSPSTAG
jgi:hypothetical protein